MTLEPRRKLRIIVLVHEDLVPPDSLNGLSEKEKQEVKTEFDVISTLKKMGHDVYPVGLYNHLNAIGDALLEHKPHIAFNLLEEFHGYPLYDQHVVSYLELMKQAYTGCNPRGLTLAHDKALTKMILSYHRLLVPNFAVFPMNRKVKRPMRLKFPLLRRLRLFMTTRSWRSALSLFTGRTRQRQLPSSTSRAARSMWV
jgi:D-alanine-D-alanine ligase